MNTNLLTDDQNDLKYQVIVENNVLTQAATKMLAEQFIQRLPTEQQSQARIVPITESGQQILFG